MTTILITGANRGIGLELTKLYASDGASVHACCRNPESAEELAAIPGEVTIHALDVTNHEKLGALANDISEPIDIVIANAGVYGPGREAQTFQGLEAEGIREAIEINTIGALKTLQAFTPHAKRSDHKKLVAITSKMGSIDDASQGSIAYRVSKTALNMGLCCAAAELQGEGVAVAALHPGWVETSMGGPNAPTTPEESAKGLANVIGTLRPGPKAPFKDFRGETIAW